MRRYIILLFIFWGFVSAFGKDARLLSAGERSKSTTLFAPDFAYPADVIATARAFLESHPASKEPYAGSMRLLAVEEEVKAKGNIDFHTKAKAFEAVLALAEVETVPATRAMFMAYAGSLEKDASRGFTDDSLFVEAYRTAPADYPLAGYSSALNMPDPKVGLVTTVRDFIYLLMSPSGRMRLLEEGFEAPARLDLYMKVQEIKDIEEKRKYILDHLQAPDMYYMMAAYMNSPASYNLSEANYDFLKKMAQTSMPEWLSTSINNAIIYLESSKWTVIFPETTVAGLPFKLTLNSSSTDSVRLLIYEHHIIKSKKNVSSPISVILKGNSGIEKKTTTTLVTLDRGNYFAVVPETQKERLDTVFFSVTPWVVECICLPPNQRLVQVLDAVTGQPAVGIKVRVSKSDVGERKGGTLTAATDTRGIAKFNRPLNKEITLIGPLTKQEYHAELRWVSDWTTDPSPKSELENDEALELDEVKIVLERQIYHPGDTVRWLAMAQSEVQTLKGLKFEAEIDLPSSADGAEDVTITIPMDATDEYGRTSGSYALPKSCPLGHGSISVDDESEQFIVSDFRLDEIKFEDANYELKGDSVLLTGKVCNNVGAPRAFTQVQLTCGNLTDTILTDDKGEYRFLLPRVAPENKNLKSQQQATYYLLEAKTDDGYNATNYLSYSTYMDVDVYVDSRYIINTANGITFTIKSEPFGKKGSDEAVECKWYIFPDSLKIRHNEIPDPALAILSGKAPTGNVVIPPTLTDSIPAGPYVICIEPLGVKSEVSARTVMLYNDKRPELPYDRAIWLPKEYFFESVADTLNLVVGAQKDNTYLWWANVKDPDGGIGLYKLRKGFQEIKLNVRDASIIYLWTVSDGSIINKSVFFTNSGSKEEGLSVSLESLREQTFAGTKQHWTIVTRRDGKPIETAVLIDVYEKRLENFSGEPNELFTYGSRRGLFGTVESAAMQSPVPLRFSFGPSVNEKMINNSGILFPQWKYGIRRDKYLDMLEGRVGGLEIVPSEDSYGSVYRIRGLNSFGIYGARLPNQKFMDALVDHIADVKERELENKSEASDINKDLSPVTDIEVREGTVLNALWRPMLVTDAVTGTVDIDFVLPNQTSQWEVLVSAWTKDLECESIRKSFTAKKPLYVKPNLPRFVRVGDRVEIVTAITNYTDSAQAVSYDITVNRAIFMNGKIELGPSATKFVTIPLDIEGELALSDTLSFTFKATNGTYGDGERVEVPIRPSTALAIESQPFYMNPADTVLHLQVPANADNELYFTVNPMSTILDGIKDFVKDSDAEGLSIGTAVAQKWYVAKTAEKIVRRYPQAAKMLPSGDDFVGMRKDAIAQLTDFQKSDGGFVWSKWSTDASLFTTLNILGWLDEDTDEPEIQKITIKALDYSDRAVTANAGEGNVNLYYTYVRGAYGMPENASARALMANTVNYVLQSWKELSVNDKSIAALILNRNGRSADAINVLESIRQYGVLTPDRGLVFPNMPGIEGYSTMLRAFKTIAPHDTVTIDAIRQALLCQRRGATWRTAAQTAYAVRALFSSGTEWLLPEGKITIQIDGKDVIDPTLKQTGSVSMPVDGNIVTIHRHEPVNPAYGALVSKRVLPLNDVAAYSTPQLRLSKTLYVNDNGKRVEVDSSTALHPGQRVTVCLRAFTDTEMTDVMIKDDRSAAFEPLRQNPYTDFVRPLSALTPLVIFTVVNGNNTTDVYIDRLPRGETQFEYDVIVNNGGTFTTGIATLVSGEDPSLTVHSASTILNVASNN